MTRTSRTAARADGFERRASTAVRVAPAQPTAHAGVVTRVLVACVDLAVVVLVALLIDLGAAAGCGPRGPRRGSSGRSRDPSGR
jgi:hypothetical protein